MRTFIFETTTIASELTILTFTFERWLSICRVFYAKRLSKSFSRVFKNILFIWLFSIGVSTPYVCTIKVYNLVENDNDSKICTILKDKSLFMANVISISVVFFFLIPTILISCMYSHMAIKLWRSQKGFIKTFGRKFTPKPKIKEDSENLFNKQSSHSKFNESNFETRNKDQLRMSKVRRSRRDVIKMLCMFFLTFLMI